MNSTEKSLSKEIKRLKQIRDDNHWESVRSRNNFLRSSITTATGERAIWIPRDNAHNKDLQSSRSVNMKGVEDISDIESGFEEGMILTHTDQVRIEEMKETLEIYNRLGHQENLKEFKIKGMCEIGFRYPRLMSYYQNEYDVPVIGYDVSRLAVDYGKSKGYNVKECDLNEDIPDMSGYNLVVMYHVLEHLKNPEVFLKNLYEKLEPNTFCHFEVPIEHDNPQFAFGHLFGFHPSDLLEYMINAGFLIASMSMKNICGAAVFTERVIGVKGLER